MHSNTNITDNYIREIVRRQHIFSTFMESFNTGVALPPVMANVINRVSRIEEQRTGEVKDRSTSVIETEETAEKPCPFKAKCDELSSRIIVLENITRQQGKLIADTNRSMIQLNAALEEALKRIHSLENRPTTSVSGDVVTKSDLQAAEKRITKELTDKIDAEIIDADERFTEKLTESIAAVKALIDEDDEDEEEDEEEDGLDDVIDMN